MTELQEKSFHFGIETGTFSSKRNQIFQTIKKTGALTLKELKKILNAKEVSDINGRLSELNDSGIVTTETKLNQTYYRLTFEHEIKSVIEQRSEERFNRWKKQGEKHNFITRLNLLKNV